MPGSRSIGLKFFVWGLVAIALAAILFTVFRGRPRATTNATDPSAAVPFRPRVSYESQNVSVTNTEPEPYLDASLNIYIDGTLYSAPLGTILPGQTVKRPLRSLRNERGKNFDPARAGISELEVRARFGGYAVHKDFPAPSQKPPSQDPLR
jgi:hypothetical protein